MLSGQIWGDPASLTTRVLTLTLSPATYMYIVQKEFLTFHCRNADVGDTVSQLVREMVGGVGSVREEDRNKVQSFMLAICLSHYY